jgi:DNA-binding transcriptional ArsR family regulator
MAQPRARAKTKATWKDRLAERPEATPEEFKAMAHPLRLRILRLCLHDSLTNQEIATHLGKDPATVLYHVRMLVRTGFLEAEDVRTGSTGALEKPYRATGKSWTLSAESAPPDKQVAANLAVIDAFRAEVLEAGPEASRYFTRLGLKLDQASLDELLDRLWDVAQEFADRPDSPDGDRYGLFIAVHKRA